MPVIVALKVCVTDGQKQYNLARFAQRSQTGNLKPTNSVVTSFSSNFIFLTSIHILEERYLHCTEAIVHKYMNLYLVLMNERYTGKRFSGSRGRGVL